MGNFKTLEAFFKPKREQTQKEQQLTAANQNLPSSVPAGKPDTAQGARPRPSTSSGAAVCPSREATQAPLGPSSNSNLPRAVAAKSEALAERQKLRLADLLSGKRTVTSGPPASAQGSQGDWADLATTVHASCADVSLTVKSEPGPHSGSSGPASTDAPSGSAQGLEGLTTVDQILNPGHTLAPSRPRDDASVAPPPEAAAPDCELGALEAGVQPGQLQRPPKRPCLGPPPQQQQPLQQSQGQKLNPSQSKQPSGPLQQLLQRAAAKEPLREQQQQEQQAPPFAGVRPSSLPPCRNSLTSALHDRSRGHLPAASRQGLWWQGPRQVGQVRAWDVGMRLRPPAVIHQDAVTQLALGGNGQGGGGCGNGGDGVASAAAAAPAGLLLAVVQANQHVRIVPYETLRDRAEAAARELEEVEGEEEGEEEGGEGGGEAEGLGLGGGMTRGRGRRAGQELGGWDELAAGPGVSNGGLTVSMHTHVAALGWDPRRSGRLAVVDRSTPNVTLLDLGAGAAGLTATGAFERRDYRRSYLTAGDGAAAGAIRALTYLTYGPRTAPYTLAAAGRGSGTAAAVALWDERCGRAPVSRLACPGGSPLVTPLETSQDGTALMGVVQPGTLVVWDVRRAASTAASSSLLSLGSSAPPPTAIAAAWDLTAPLAAAGCPRPSQGGCVSSLATDPWDAARLAVVLQDGSCALWSMAAAAVTHVSAAASGGCTASAASGLAAGPVVGGASASPLVAAATALGTPLYGTWDADVNGFWHPTALAPVMSLSAMLGEPQLLSGGGSGGGTAWEQLLPLSLSRAAAAGVSASATDGIGSLAPGLGLMDCRLSAALARGDSSSGCGGAAGAVGVGAMAGQRPDLSLGTGAAVVVSSARPSVGLTRAGSGVGVGAAVGIASGGGGGLGLAMQQLAGVGGAATRAGAGPAAAAPPAATVGVADWPLCVCSLPGCGDVLVGTLRGRMVYLRKQ